MLLLSTYYCLLKVIMVTYLLQSNNLLAMLSGSQDTDERR